MTNDQVAWMARKLYSIVSEDRRGMFLDLLKNEENYITSVIAYNIENLAIEYIFEKNEVVIMTASTGDLVASARQIVEYMRNSMLKDELAQLS